MSTAKFNQWVNPDGSENYKCRAWVNFNGTGTVAIRASGNVTSITDNGTGDYTVNFTTAMPDANYAVAGIAGTTDGTQARDPHHRNSQSGSYRLTVQNASAALSDVDTVFIQVFR